MRTWRPWEFKPVRARTPWLVEGAARAHWKCVRNETGSYDRWGDLTSRFIKFPQPIPHVMKKEEEHNPKNDDPASGTSDCWTSDRRLGHAERGRLREQLRGKVLKN